MSGASIVKTMEASTGNLPRETAEAIEDGSFGKPAFGVGEYGFVFTVSGKRREEVRDDLEASGVACEHFITLAQMAAAEGCSYLVFDRDADLVEGLPYFDW